MRCNTILVSLSFLQWRANVSLYYNESRVYLLFIINSIVYTDPGREDKNEKGKKSFAEQSEINVTSEIVLFCTQLCLTSGRRMLQDC